MVDKKRIGESMFRKSELLWGNKDCGGIGTTPLPGGLQNICAIM